MLVGTLMVAMLTVDVWRARAPLSARPPHPCCSAAADAAPPAPGTRFYYSRSLNCCAEVRGFLGCSADYTAPCLGFDGDCGDLAEQFKDVPDSGLPDDYECTAFPDEKSARDKIIVGVICFAIGLPFTLVLEELFAMRRAAARPTHRPRSRPSEPRASRWSAAARNAG